ncbi:MAG: beta-hydroxyacyl-ACP dehydratase [Bacteroidales bacterium]|nr:beta-hydroxyacyl-ACP dehydratase [Bacteroidales bacterium]
MLSGSFFEIQSFTSDSLAQETCKIHAVVSLISNHPVYQGHFPGNPVVPGVCQIQMVRELVEKALKHPVKLTESDNIKFLSIINPQINSKLDFDISLRNTGDQKFAATASIGNGTTVFLKFKGKFDSSG